MAIIDSVVEAVRFFGDMAWKTWWALVLGFTISGVVQAFVSEDRMTDLLGGRGLRALGLGSFFGFLSSSCSFGAVATTKSIFGKGASPEASFAGFQFASTNLVIEIGLVMWLLLGWQFVAADVFGGLVMILLLALITKYVVPDSWFEAARANVDGEDDSVRDPVCGMEVDPDSDGTLSLETDGGTEYFCSESCKQTYQNRDESDDWTDKLLTVEGWKNVFRNAMGEWDMLWTDIVGGFAIAALIATFVPESFWTGLFSIAPEGTFAWVALGSVIGVIVGVVVFICSVGNIPFALVLWQAGIPFGGLMSFIFADLIIPNIVNMYRKYYGARLAAVLFVSIFALAAVTGVLVHYAFSFATLIPPAGEAGGTAPSDYTTVLNVVFSVVFLAEVYVTYFASSGGESDEESMTHAD